MMFAASPLEVRVEQSLGDVSCLQLASTKEPTIEALDSFNGGVSVNKFNVHFTLEKDVRACYFMREDRTTYRGHLLDLNPLDSAVLRLNFALDVFGEVQIPVPFGLFFGIEHVVNNDSRSRVHRWHLGPNS